MTTNRLPDYLEHIRRAAREGADFVRDMDKPAFLADRRTQQAVMMSLVIVGEAAAKIMDSHAEFVRTHPDVPWRAMRGMRNRMAHGYFDVNLDLVWDTAKTALPDLLRRLPGPPET